MIRNLIAFVVLVIVMVACDKDETDYGPIDKKIIENYLVSKGLTAQSTASGLYYIIEKPGGANHPSVSSKVSVNYKGYLVDGTIFDKSYASGQPSSFSLNSVIAGWKEGIPLIGVGGKIQLFVPSDLGYGSTVKTNIPAHSVLIFEVQLVDFY